MPLGYTRRPYIMLPSPTMWIWLSCWWSSGPTFTPETNMTGSQSTTQGQIRPSAHCLQLYESKFKTKQPYKKITVYYLHLCFEMGYVHYRICYIVYIHYFIGSTDIFKCSLNLRKFYNFEKYQFCCRNKMQHLIFCIVLVSWQINN